MIKIVNPKASDYHHNAISELSNMDRFIASGSAKGYNSKEYSWVADFLFKSTQNTSINPHSGYISFVSDKDMMYQEYGNVARIYENYQFMEMVTRSIFSDHTFELESKQYSRIGQRYFEYNEIRYVNPSEQFFATAFEPSKITNIDLNRMHEFYRAPLFQALGYKTTNEIADNLSQYVFGDVGTTRIGQYNLNVEFDAFGSDVFYDALTIYNTFTSPERVFDYKLYIDNPIYFFFEDSSDEWVMYHNEATHYQGSKYKPYYGMIRLYRDEDSSEDGYFAGSWKEEDDTASIIPYTNGLLFFPDVIRDNVLEPAKIINRFDSTVTGGKLVFNPINHLNEPNDQSRIVYNACRYMLQKNAGGDRYIFRRTDIADKIIYTLDIDTERNRRYSSVVMTEPYFVTIPLGSGTLVDYNFVDKDLEAFSAATNSWDNEPVFLKIKAPLSIINEIDSILNTEDYNTDIITTITINDIDNNYDVLNTSGDYYDKFGNNPAEFYSRQDDCLDDMTSIDYAGTEKTGIGYGNHREFLIDSFGDDEVKYGPSAARKMKVCGMGVESITILDSNGSVTSSKNMLNMYCTNYTAVNCPDPDENEIINEQIDLLTDTPANLQTAGKLTSYSSYEKFKPMIKLRGMNGYVKIMKRNNAFKVTQTSDGLFEIIYNVEFPFCPGSYQRRFNNSIGDVATGFILKKASYINAGSHGLDDDNKYDISNSRYAPYGDDSFTDHSILVTPGYSEDDSAFETSIITKQNSNGGGIDVNAPLKKRVVYPSNIVWRRLKNGFSYYNAELMLLSIIKSRHPNSVDGTNFWRYGTYDIRIFRGDANDDYGRDAKVICFADNRQWKFENNFSSYIDRENPTLVCKIDVATLLKDFTKYQNLHGSIPDTKRWLYGYFSGFASMMSNSVTEDISISSKNSTMTNNNDLESDNLESDIIIDIWDQVSKIGESITGGNWRPFMSTSYDYDKIPGSVIEDNLYIDIDYGVVSEIVEDDTVISSIKIRMEDIYPESSTTIVFPEEVNEKLNGSSNLVLYDTLDKKSYHISYITNNGDDSYIAYIKYDENTDTPLKMASKTGIFEAIFETKVIYEIRNPSKSISKDSKKEIPSIRAVDGIDLGFLVRYLDFRAGIVNPTGSSDYERFVSDGFIYFRVRVSKNKDYPVSYIDNDNSKMLFNGVNQFSNLVSLDTDKRKWINFPWSEDGVSFDAGFDWAKIEIKETLRKFGLNHFKCVSK